MRGLYKMSVAFFTSNSLGFPNSKINILKPNGVIVEHTGNKTFKAEVQSMFNEIHLENTKIRKKKKI